MADAPVVHIGQNSPEHVAYKLLEHVMSVEQKTWHSHNKSYQSADRKYLLDTYAECLEATKGLRDVAG